jgi:dTDP-4-amino-4,6-dideoxygalactose transaminase
MSRPASSDSLALCGGPPTVTRALQPFRSVGEEEAQAAAEVVRGGVLSAYIGAPGEFFLGGSRVRAFEEQAARYFGVKHAVAVNSWTSGLEACIGAIGVEPGDEIITSPWTMAATATSILQWNAIPVFADIDRETFNLDPRSVERLVSPRTRAILAVDIFGQSADMPALRAIAQRHGLKLLVDTAQAPGARIGGRYAGTLADIGGFSLNYHKHIHCGEGGIVVTDDDRLARRAQLIRNHGECVVQGSEPAELANILGHNFRMGEIEAAIASIQLGKLAARVESRQRAAARLDGALADLPGLRTPRVAPECSHVYYVYGLTLDTQALGVGRERLLEALRAEGVPGLFGGYQNIHLLPLFQRKIAYGTGGFPWTSPYASRDVSYAPGTCPVAEELHARSFFGLNLCMHEYGDEEIDQVAAAFRKVWSLLDRLREGAPRA